MVSLQRLTKVLGAVAVDGLSLEIPAGHRGFPRPTGAGKSTTLRMLTGMTKPTSGPRPSAGRTCREPIEVKAVRGVRAGLGGGL